MRGILKRSNQTMNEADAVDFIIENMLPQIAERVILMNPKTYADLKKNANLVEQSLKATQEGSSDGSALNITSALERLSLGSNQSQRPLPLNYRNTYNFNSRTSRGRPRCYNCNRIGHVIANCRSQGNNYNRQNNYNRSNNFNHRGRGQRNSNRSRGNSYRGNQRNFNNHNNRNNNNNNNNNNNQRRDNNANAALQQHNDTNQDVNLVAMIAMVGTGFEIECEVNEHAAKALVDSGASVTFLSKAFAKRHGITIDKWSGRGYTLVNGTNYKPDGQSTIKLKIILDGIKRIVELSIYIVNELPYDVLIGCNVIRKLGIIIDGFKNSIYYA